MLSVCLFELLHANNVLSMSNDVLFVSTVVFNLAYIVSITTSVLRANRILSTYRCMSCNASCRFRTFEPFVLPSSWAVAIYGLWHNVSTYWSSGQSTPHLTDPRLSTSLNQRLCLHFSLISVQVNHDIHTRWLKTDLKVGCECWGWLRSSLNKERKPMVQSHDAGLTACLVRDIKDGKRRIRCWMGGTRPSFDDLV